MYLFDEETKDWIVEKLESNDCKISVGTFIIVIHVTNIKFIFSASGNFVKFMDVDLQVIDTVFKLNKINKLQKDLSDSLNMIIKKTHETSTQEKIKNLINFD